MVGLHAPRGATCHTLLKVTVEHKMVVPRACAKEMRARGRGGPSKPSTPSQPAPSNLSPHAMSAAEPHPLARIHVGLTAAPMASANVPPISRYGISPPAYPREAVPTIRDPLDPYTDQILAT